MIPISTIPEPIDFDLLDRHEALLANLLTILRCGGPVGSDERDEMDAWLWKALLQVRAMKARRVA